MRSLHASPAARSVSLAPAVPPVPPQARGGFFWAGDARLCVRAVSYGSFAVTSHGSSPRGSWSSGTSR